MAKVLLFDPLSDDLGTEAPQVELSEDINSVSDLIGFLLQRGQLWKKYLQLEKLQITVNRQFSSPGTTISNTDEIALIPLPILFSGLSSESQLLVK